MTFIYLMSHPAAESQQFQEPSSGPQGYKTFFMLNSAETKTLNAHTY